MITCTLRDKKHSIDFVSGRALRELEPAAKMYAKMVHHPMIIIRKKGMGSIVHGDCQRNRPLINSRNPQFRREIGSSCGILQGNPASLGKSGACYF